MHNVITARIKIMANLNVAERRVPQDGRVELEVDFRKIDVRIATLPTLHGEKIVIRILDLGHGLSSVSSLGFSEPNERRFLQQIEASSGVVLITGPTGSGKSTTLYSALSHLNRDDVNIITVEDPVEYQLDGVNQVQVHHAAGMTFSRGLRAILRQDPNVIMIGEIRDAETAEIAVRAAITGHLVLSTLHTNSAAGAVTRLADMGVEPFLISSSVRCVVAQRLVRKICPHCKTEYEPLPAEIKRLSDHGLYTNRLFHGAGCGDCGRTGYKGRIAIHEVLEVDDAMRAMVLAKRSDHDYFAHALKQGMIPLMADGLRKAAEGQTTLAEVYRVLGKE
ncbi:GspE/PulE family protein [Paenibacillus protaetiae]|uniref:GspE/PulE family protein n=1 Tax=Paenibacillus protaetiae TaxID=2509456 RepID=UPI0026D0CE0F